MKDKNFWWLMVYILNVLLYIPFAISFSLGTLAAVHLLYSNIAKKDKPERDSFLRLHPIAVGLLCIFPQILLLVCNLLPTSFNELTSFELSNGRFFVYPGPLFLLLPIMPIIIVWRLYGLHISRPYNLFRPRLVCLLVLITVVCVPSLIYYWYDRAINSFGNPWMNIHLGLKSFYYNGLWEELHYRFLLIPIFRGYFKKNTSIVLTSLLFALTHFELVATFLTTCNPNSIIALGGIFMLGIANGYCFCITKSIIPCVILHGFSSGLARLIGGIGQLVILNHS